MYAFSSTPFPNNEVRHFPPNFPTNDRRRTTDEKQKKNEWADAEWESYYKEWAEDNSYGTIRAHAHLIQKLATAKTDPYAPWRGRAFRSLVPILEMCTPWNARCGNKPRKIYKLGHALSVHTLKCSREAAMTFQMLVILEIYEPYYLWTRKHRS